MNFQNPTNATPLGAYDINAFCKAHHISRAHFYKLISRGEGPELMRAGKRVLISIESAQRWRAECEHRSKLLDPRQ
jgi:predicted DNA-binding transcriptional regulator AlpA